MIEELTRAQSGAVAPQFRVLNTTDAALIWVLKWAGDAEHVIANKLGTMPSRVADVLAKNTHVGSRDQATRMVAQREDANHHFRGYQQKSKHT